MQKKAEQITVRTSVNVPLQRAWELWTTPKFIEQWNFASDDWCTPHAELDLQVGGRFSYRMEAKDKSFGFDFSGTFTVVKPLQQIAYVLGDERKVNIDFIATNNGVEIVECFEAENTNSVELQRTGWQAILDNFRKLANTQK